MNYRDRTLKEILDESKRSITPVDYRGQGGTVDIPKYKMVRDGAVTIPAKSISAPQIAVSLIKNEIKIQHNHFGDGIEIMVLVLLNIDNYPIMTKTVGVGASNHVIVDPGEVFSLVLSPHFGTSGFILGHNHPSGSILLSEEDRLLLRDFKDLGRRLNRPLRDFIVIGDGTDKYYSHKNESYEL